MQTGPATNAEPDGRNPYPGPRPFEEYERDVFFGREREVTDLLSLIVAHRTVLLHAQSGAGKTSLLNAALIPALGEEGFEVLPLTRVRGFQQEGGDARGIDNIYVLNTLVSWEKTRADPCALARTSLAAYLRSREHPRDAEGLASPRAIIFDQFEELFTFCPERWKDREGFFRQVNEALEDDPLLRVLFVIREDYLAELDRYCALVPEDLQTQYRLERLRAEAACLAVQEPLRNTERSFAAEVAPKLVQHLLTVHVENAAGEMVAAPGEYVEPVQLQVVCQSLWRNLPPEVKIITAAHLQEFGDVEEALSDFYAEAIDAVRRAIQVDEDSLRHWFSDRLITAARTRGTVFRGKEYTEGIPNAAVDILERQHVIRSEPRAGARWYELTHDRLIEPIRKANDTWFQDRREEEQQRQIETERRRAEEQQQRAREQTEIAERLRRVTARSKVVAAVAVLFAVFALLLSAATYIAMKNARFAKQDAETAQKREKEARQTAQRAEQSAEAAKLRAESEAGRAREQAEMRLAVVDFIKQDLLGPIGPAEGEDAGVNIRGVLDAASHGLKTRDLDELTTASICSTLGVLYLRLGRYESAVQNLASSMKVFQDQLSENPRDALDCMNSLGLAYEGLGSQGKAEQHCTEALESARKTLAKGDPLLLKLKRDLAGLYKKWGRYREANGLYQEAWDDSLGLGEKDPPGGSRFSMAGGAGRYSIL
jgi:hypothetical protein